MHRMYFGHVYNVFGSALRDAFRVSKHVRIYTPGIIALLLSLALHALKSEPLFVGFLLLRVRCKYCE